MTRLKADLTAIPAELKGIPQHGASAWQPRQEPAPIYEGTNQIQRTVMARQLFK